MELNRILITLILGISCHWGIVVFLDDDGYLNNEVRFFTGALCFFFNFFMAKVAPAMCIATYAIKCVVELLVSRRCDSLAVVINLAVNLLMALITFVIWVF